MPKLRRMSAGFYVTKCGRYYVVATERCGADGRRSLKGRSWWNAGRRIDNDNHADDATFGTKRDAVSRLAEVMREDAKH